MPILFLEAASANSMGGITTIIMLVAMLAIFYFFMYRPQKKQESQTQSKASRDFLTVARRYLKQKQRPRKMREYGTITQGRETLTFG